MASCVLDTDVVIAALDRSDAHHAQAVAAFARFSSDRVELAICTVNFATAERVGADLASFDKRVRRALRPAGLSLAASLR